MSDTGKPIPTDDEGFIPDSHTGEGIFAEDVDHWVDLRINYNDDDLMPAPSDIATFVEIAIHNAMEEGWGPFPGSLKERERIADSVTVGVMGSSGTET